MIFYSQSKGKFTLLDGTILGGCYAGGDHGDRPDGVNNPLLQAVEDVGPLPQGQYTISPAHTVPHLGPCVMALTPDPSNRMFGRSAFYCHGDNQQLNHSGSDGCIVAGPAVRQQIADLVSSGEDQLTVTT